MSSIVLPAIALTTAAIPQVEFRPAAGLQIPLSTTIRQNGPGDLFDRKSIDASWNFRAEFELALPLSAKWRCTAGTGLEPEVRLARNLEGAGFQILSPYLGVERIVWSEGASILGSWGRVGWTVPMATDEATRAARLTGDAMIAGGIVMQRDAVRLSAGWSLFGARIRTRNSESDWWQNRLQFSTGIAWP